MTLVQRAYNIYPNNLVFSYFLACSTRLAKGFSQVYILITCMPEMISSINWILSSVFLVVLDRISDIFLPIQPVNKTIVLGKYLLNYVFINLTYKPCNGMIIIKVAIPNKDDTPISCHKKYVTTTV